MKKLASHCGSYFQTNPPYRYSKIKNEKVFEIFQ